MEGTDQIETKFPDEQNWVSRPNNDEEPPRRSHWKVSNPFFVTLLGLSAAASLLTGIGDKDPNIIKKNYINRAISQVEATCLDCLTDAGEDSDPAAVKEVKIKVGDQEVGVMFVPTTQEEGAYPVTLPAESGALKNDFKAAKAKVASNIDTIGGLPTVTIERHDGNGTTVIEDIAKPNLWNEQVAYYSATVVRGVRWAMLERTVGDYFNDAMKLINGKSSTQQEPQNDAQLAAGSKEAQPPVSQQYYAYATNKLHRLIR